MSLMSVMKFEKSLLYSKMTQQGMTSSNCILDLMQRFRGSRRLVLLIVAIALLLDNMLLSSVGKYTDSVSDDDVKYVLVFF
ncbi:hypothetical protein TNCT_26431 [Trichonephila clavata]|uniref:Uncharacterized protein n=1 Tax=Trichonephila clavata TaxID=2740835 RepID=A0A8X6F275_TRICU|nr:hypothetical protein TNCT_26431 [Trichonephila clavata]